jgi:hypothetical protein
MITSGPSLGPNTAGISPPGDEAGIIKEQNMRFRCKESRGWPTKEKRIAF